MAKMSITAAVPAILDERSSPVAAGKPRDVHSETRMKLDEEIAQLEERLISLKRERNTLTPITHLHSEILQEIFLLVHISSKYNGKCSLLVTWVSHTWRELALNTSALWSHINFKNPQWIEAALSRTKNHELEFDFNSSGAQIPQRIHNMRKSDERASRLVSLCLGNLSRIRKLKLVSRPTEAGIIFPETAPQWQIPAPVLVKLDLQGVKLPRNLFGGTCPSLQSLNLASCTIDWDTLPASEGLKNISIIDPQTQTSASIIVSLLHKTSTSLENLRLRDVFDPRLSNSTLSNIRNVDRIHLPRLDSLQLESSEAAMFERLLNQISLPPRISLDIVLSDWSESSVSMIKALVVSRDLKTWPVDDMSIDYADQSVTIRLLEDWDRTNSGPEPRHLDEKEFIPFHEVTDIQVDHRNYIELKIRTVTEVEVPHLLAIFPILPFSLPKVFLDGVANTFLDVSILGYIGKLGTVKELWIHPTSLETFRFRIQEQEDELQTLFGEGEDFTGSLDPERMALAQDIVSFRGLQKLKLSAYMGHQPFSHRAVEDLQKWLEWRKRFGIQLDVLVISGMKVPPNTWMKEMIYDGLVGKFEMVGVIETDEEEESEDELDYEDDEQNEEVWIG